MFLICCIVCDFVIMEEVEIKIYIGIKYIGEDRKIFSELNSFFLFFFLVLSDLVNSKDDLDGFQKNKGGNNLLVIFVMFGSQFLLNSEEKLEKGFECVFCNFVCKMKNMFECYLQIYFIIWMFECDVCYKFMKIFEQLLEYKKCYIVFIGGFK